jgi:hypothetical protein
VPIIGRNPRFLLDGLAWPFFWVEDRGSIGINSRSILLIGLRVSFLLAGLRFS